MYIAFVAFLAIFTQSVTGFGLALVSMPLLVGVLGLQTATPLGTLIGATAEIILLIRHREAFNFRSVARLSLASMVGVPVGVFVLGQFDTEIITRLLGILIASYAAYALITPSLPQLAHQGWAYGFGFLAGVLSGAYNTSGPPVVIYGSCRRWQPAEFKSNLQGFFLLNSAMTFLSHAASHNFSQAVWQNYWLALPGIGLGLVVGFLLDKYINPHTFRRVVLVLLLVLGIRLVL